MQELSFLVCISVFISFFFFQAEDGIRDGTVTGVQTCALPISLPTTSTAGARPLFAAALASCTSASRARSEERRVGKEGRTRGSWLSTKHKGTPFWWGIRMPFREEERPRKSVELVE